jgi:hypothetical protein
LSFTGFDLEQVDLGDVTLRCGARIESGHHMAEEAPEAVAAELLAFFE